MTRNPRLPARIGVPGASAGPDHTPVQNVHPVDVLTELRRRMGADAVWFARLAVVPGRVPAVRTSGQQPQVWVADVWSDGHPAMAHALDGYAGGPLLQAIGVDLRAEPDVWSTPRVFAADDPWWRQRFAAQVYVRQRLLEEHRFLVTAGEEAVGVLCAVWDERRVGVARRLGAAARNGHGKWAAAELTKMVAAEDARTERQAGELLLSSEGAVMYASDSALLWLDDSRALALRHALLRALEPDSLLSTWVDKVLTVVAGAEVDLTPLRGTHGSAWLARVRPLTLPVLTPEALLTPAQLAVARAMVAGQNIPETARQLGKSPETVRTQIKQCYARLGINNRLALVKRLAEARSPGAQVTA